ncbi:MAG: hypothetical protein LBO69_05020 [Ignavibacteria bacterium]|jgi:hypothetical protein|nr:hypothetical protein [Ignavibacteria bacterium]
MKIRNTPPILIIAIICSLLLSNATSAIDKGDKSITTPQKTKERMDMVKKMKLLEILDLDSSKSEKFLQKYCVFEKKIEENRKQQRKVAELLDDQLRKMNKGDDGKKFAPVNDSLLALQEEFNKLICEKQKTLKPILSDVEFAKYLNFENNFFKEFFGSYMDGKKKHKPDMPAIDKNKIKPKTSTD